MNRPEVERDKSQWDLAAETVTVRIRWFGLCVGYVLVNFVDRDPGNRLVLNAILTLGALYAMIDTVWSLRGKVFLAQFPLAISLMEAVFIGLLCYFDRHGVESPFRFYYFLSLLVCAIRHSSAITYATFALHAVSFSFLTLSPEFSRRQDMTTLVLTLILAGLGNVGQHGAREPVEIDQPPTGRTQRTNCRTISGSWKSAFASARWSCKSRRRISSSRKNRRPSACLAAGIAHEVGNPLAAISSLVQMLKRRQNDSYTGERLAMVDDQLRRIQRTLRELVDFSRPATKDRRLCDIHEVLDAALNIAKYYKRKKGKRIVTRYADGLPKLRVVRDQLVQVFLNLVLNSLDATEEGGTIELTTELKDGWIRVAVRDDGVGIPDGIRRPSSSPISPPRKRGPDSGCSSAATSSKKRARVGSS